LAVFPTPFPSIVATFKVIIPARYASTRLPGKPLRDLAGKPMIVRVAEQAGQSDASEVYVATDHEETATAIARMTMTPVEAVMTSSNHRSGTERIAEVVAKKGFHDEDIIVNVQGDEPLMDPQLINKVARQLSSHAQAAMATACCPIHEKSVLMNPNVVKVALDHNNFALYFSRAPIPYARDAFAESENMPPGMPCYQHIGIYAYRVKFLKKYKSLKPAPAESYEALEQLRALWHGYKIHVSVTDHAPIGVDTPEDLARVEAILNSS
jgi:3-deoxy-manno-octulosonate cytidylyltransferase (CMP-KDO synthetase)